MSRITETFAKLKQAGRKAFMPYLMAGDPDLQTTIALLETAEQSGADLVELGVPFSDPMADGPTIQLAAERSLRSGTTVRGVLETLAKARERVSLPVMLMGYYNPFFQYGLERLCREAATAGADGLIVPDVQTDDAAELRPHADKYGMDTVFLIAPTSTPARLKAVARESRGFVYAVSLTGVTGKRDRLPPELSGFIRDARRQISLPLCVGFGIGTPELAAEAAGLADGVISGSAVVHCVAEAVARGDDPRAAAGKLIRGMAEAVHKVKA